MSIASRGIPEGFPVIVISKVEDLQGQKGSFFESICTDGKINCSALVSMADPPIGIGDRTWKRVIL